MSRADVPPVGAWMCRAERGRVEARVQAAGGCGSEGPHPRRSMYKMGDGGAHRYTELPSNEVEYRF